MRQPTRTRNETNVSPMQACLSVANKGWPAEPSVRLAWHYVPCLVLCYLHHKDAHRDTDVPASDEQESSRQ
jgi:hypothetical protein